MNFATANIAVFLFATTGIIILLTVFIVTLFMRIKKTNICMCKY